jgi:hypothetical protein
MMSCSHALPLDSNGEGGSFLSSVRRESAMLPSILVAPSNWSSSSRDNIECPHEGILSTEAFDGSLNCQPFQRAHRDWQKSILAHFLCIRSSLTRLRERFEHNAVAVGSSARYRQQLRGQAISVPPLKASDAWHTFCLGSNNLFKSRGIDAKNDNNDYPNKVQETVDLKISFVRVAALPSLSLILQFDQILTLKVLRYHIEWLELVQTGSNLISVSPNLQLVERCRWAYALLANLASPLHRDTMSDIRRLYITTTYLYTNLKSVGSNSDSSSLAIISVITGRYFHQAPNISGVS